MRDIVGVDQGIDEVSGETIIAAATRGQSGGRGQRKQEPAHRFSVVATRGDVPSVT